MRRECQFIATFDYAERDTNIMILMGSWIMSHGLMPLSIRGDLALPDDLAEDEVSRLWFLQTHRMDRVPDLA